MALEKIPSGSDRNVSQITANFIDCALALQGSGADKAMAQFITDNTGIVAAFCERLIDLRNNEIEECTIVLLLAGVFTGGGVDEYEGICIDRRTGKYAIADNVPAEHRATLRDKHVVAIRHHVINGRKGFDRKVN